MDYQPSFWVELLKFGVLSVFVTAVVEVAKSVLFLFGKKISESTIKIMTFSFAVYICYGLDYGVLTRVIESGEHVRALQAQWIDYVGTGGLVMMGAHWAFDQFASLIAKAKATKKAAEGA